MIALCLRVPIPASIEMSVMMQDEPFVIMNKDDVQTLFTLWCNILKYFSNFVSCSFSTEAEMGTCQMSTSAL